MRICSFYNRWSHPRVVVVSFPMNILIVTFQFSYRSDENALSFSLLDAFGSLSVLVLNSRDLASLELSLALA